MDKPYFVDTYRRIDQDVEYVIMRAGEDALVRGQDLVFMHRLVELLNQQEHEKEGR